VGVEAQIIVAVVDDQQQAMAAQVVGKHHPPIVYRPDGCALGRADQPAFPGQVLRPHGAVAFEDFALQRPWQLAAQAGKRVAAGQGQVLDGFFEAGENGFQLLALAGHFRQALLV